MIARTARYQVALPSGHVFPCSTLVEATTALHRFRVWGGVVGRIVVGVGK